MNIFLKNKIFFQLLRIKVIECIRFDSKVATFILFLFQLLKYTVARAKSSVLHQLLIAGEMYRYSQLAFVRRFAVSCLHKQLDKQGKRKIGELIFKGIEPKINLQLVASLKDSLLQGEPNPFDKRCLILSPPQVGKKGVILLKFTDYFKYFLSIFDMNKLSNDYVLVLEPSSIGQFDLDLLCFVGQNIPVIVQSLEPRDISFLKSLHSNIFPIEIGANLWVDESTFHPIEKTEKEFDLLMVAIFADVKRHYHLFEALKKSKKRLKVALAYVEWGKRLQDIKNEADYYGVLDQITFFEKVPQDEVNKLLNKSKFSILLSKKEGTNKASVESLYAGTPLIILKQHNYGHQYSYLNENTAIRVKGHELWKVFKKLDSIYNSTPFNPAGWIREHHSPEKSTAVIIQELQRIESILNIQINTNLEIKVNKPELNYRDVNNWKKYKNYFQNLKQYVKI